VLAFLLLFHMIGAAIAIAKRGEARPVVTAARVAAGAIILQVIVAAAMVETRLPPSLQSVHQAVGTLVWVAVVVFALLARRGANSLGTARVFVGQPAPVVTPRGAES
jgi:heme A synthase